MPILSPTNQVIIDVDNYPTLSKASVNGMTPQWIEDRAADGYLESFVWRQMLLGGLVGVKENALCELLLSRARGGKGSGIELTEQKVGPFKSYFMPYILREKEDVINAFAFSIQGGSANSDAGTTVNGVTYSTGSWEVAIRNSSSEWGSDIKNLERYFLPGETVIVHNLSPESAVQRPVFTVESVSNDNQGNTQQALVYIKPPFTNTEWGNLTADQQAVYQPTEGVVIIGTNSVSDYENYCHNQPADLSRRVHAYFVQTSRFTRSWDDEYEKYLNYIFEGKVNIYLEKFKQLPAAEQNRKMYYNYLTKWMHSVFWGAPANQQQSVNAYQGMPQVVDPRTGTFIHYKGEATGLYQQLAASGRVIDNKAQRLNFNTLEELLYQLKRHRETRTSGTVEDIDCMTDRHTANRIRSLMFQYYTKKYGTTNYVTYTKDEPIVSEVNGKKRVLWYKQSYEIPEAHVVLHVIVENFMADWKRHFPAHLRSAANQLWFIDWKDFTLGIAETAMRRSKTPDLETDPDFRCTIKANYTHYDMESITWSPMIGEESQHLIVENFSDDCPVYTAQVCAAQESSTSNSVDPDAFV